MHSQRVLRRLMDVFRGQGLVKCGGGAVGVQDANATGAYGGVGVKGVVIITEFLSV